MEKGYIKHTVMVVGTFRSGTNLVKHILTNNFHCDVVFSKWFWKHGLPPTRMNNNTLLNIPIIVVVKDPYSLNLSLYNFWKIRRPELDVGENLSDFIQKRFVVYENTNGVKHPQYIFSTPTEYWNQFHYSWINWKVVNDNRIFLKYEDFIKNPDSVIRDIAKVFGLSARHNETISIPKKHIAPSADGETTVMVDNSYKTEESLKNSDIHTISRLLYEPIVIELEEIKAKSKGQST